MRRGHADAVDAVDGAADCRGAVGGRPPLGAAAVVPARDSGRRLGLQRLCFRNGACSVLGEVRDAHAVPAALHPVLLAEERVRGHEEAVREVAGALLGRVCAEAAEDCQLHADAHDWGFRDGRPGVGGLNQAPAPSVERGPHGPPGRRAPRQKQKVGRSDQRRARTRRPSSHCGRHRIPRNSVRCGIHVAERRGQVGASRNEKLSAERGAGSKAAPRPPRAWEGFPRLS
mmetsp:Transcript_10119/g.39417  ORF Transcript_10119/g.39417 Transcript_10119/m.39417 type:complete len:229 (+) Transcript_10119:1050-1736(+)